jgi:hypothetical protein
MTQRQSEYTTVATIICLLQLKFVSTSTPDESLMLFYDLKLLLIFSFSDYYFFIFWDQVTLFIINGSYPTWDFQIYHISSGIVGIVYGVK